MISKEPVSLNLGTFYSPHKIEEWVKNFWESERIYDKIKELSRRRARKYVFIDGPPYPSSPSIHPGTAWNKIIKDSYLRFWRLQGYNVYDTPGYDMHGLPIEYQVEKSYGISSKKEIIEKIGIENFVNRCREFVLRNAESMTKIFKDLGVFMDWNNPYMTITDDYIEEAWKLIKKADDRGLLDRELRVVHWCPRCQTVLTDYEVSQEYRDLEDPSIYVKFPIVGRENEYLVIWTTTPWTLPANIFVMARGSAYYVRVRVDNEVYIMAENLYKRVLEKAGIKSYVVIEKILGKDLSDLRYTHPLKDLVKIQETLEPYHKVILADEYVSLEEGTGLVHAAPGHGAEDFDVAKRYNIPVYSLVEDDGRFSELAGKYAGKNAREANNEIIEDLRRLGYLLHEERIVHRYPLCWRCKTPLLLRATYQWIIKVSKLRSKMLEETNKIRWIPRWALDRTNSLVENLQDWVISRQRFWGTPLPIWICENCGYRIVVGERDDLVKYGANKIPKELHRPWIDEVTLKCPRCGGIARRVPDVADVWLDSGVSFYASLGRNGHEIFDKEIGEIDMIVEGHDQTRGWFFSTIRSGVILFDRKPVKTIVSHGFMLDEKGREMHKSLGNFVEVPVIIERVGRDPFRLFLLSNTVWEDMRFSIDKVRETLRDLNIVWNVFTFAKSYMETDKFLFKEENLLSYYENKVFREEDLWLLSRFYELLTDVTDAMSNYRVHEATNKLMEFIIDDVSRWYLRIIRRRVWTEEASEDKEAVYLTLFYVLKNWLIMSSMIIPHLAEYLYQFFVKLFDRGARESVNMEIWPSKDLLEKIYDKDLVEAFGVARDLHEMISTARMRAGLKLRKPVQKCFVFLRNPGLLKYVNRARRVLMELVNCRDIEVHTDLYLVEKYVYFSVEPDLGLIGREFKRETPKILEYIRERASEIARELLSKNEVEVFIEDKKYVLKRDYIRIIESARENYSFASGDLGYVIIDTRIPEEMILESIAREIIRRIQVMRKELGLHLLDQITTYIFTRNEEFIKAIDTLRNYISSETRSIEVKLVSEPADVRGELVREWDIEEEKVVIGVAKS